MITITINRIDRTEAAVIVEGTLGLSGEYVAGGDTLDFTGVNSTLVYAAEAAQQANQIPSNLAPLGLVEVFEQPANGTVPKGYIPFFIPGTTMANGLLWIATALGQPPTELGAGAYPAGAIAQTTQFRAFFNYGV
jgi:hypothetical protein